MAIDRNGWFNMGDINFVLDEYQAVTNRTITALYGDEYNLIKLKDENDFKDAFNSCPPLKAIIGKRAKAFNTGKIKLFNVNTERPAPGYNWLKKLIKKPNVLQKEAQFQAQQNFYIDIFGYCPMLKIRAAGLPEDDPESISSLWNIPPWLFDLDYTGKWLKQIEKSGIYKEFRIKWGDKEHILDMKDMSFIFDDGIGTENDTNLTIPDSRMIGYELVISNIIAAYKSRNTLITKRGAIGILSNNGQSEGVGIPLAPHDKRELQQDFHKYGLTGQMYQVIITNANLKWQQMAMPTKDLMLFEETQENIERLCDAYGWPPELIARSKDVTYDNKIQARKDLYQNVIIPESESRMQQFTEAIGVEAIDIRRDYSEVPVLQTDRKTLAETRKAINEYCEMEFKNGLMTKNEWREELGLEKIAKPEFDKYIDELTPEENKKVNEDEDENEDASED